MRNRPSLKQTRLFRLDNVAFRGVQLLHQLATGASKRVTNLKLKAPFNWEILAKHDKSSLSDISLRLFFIQLVFKNQCILFSNTVNQLVLVLTIAI